MKKDNIDLYKELSSQYQMYRFIDEAEGDTDAILESDEFKNLFKDYSVNKLIEAFNKMLEEKQLYCLEFLLIYALVFSDKKLDIYNEKVISLIKALFESGDLHCISRMITLLEIYNDTNLSNKFKELKIESKSLKERFERLFYGNI